MVMIWIWKNGSDYKKAKTLKVFKTLRVCSPPKKSLVMILIVANGLLLPGKVLLFIHIS